MHLKKLHMQLKKCGLLPFQTSGKLVQIHVQKSGEGNVNTGVVLYLNLDRGTNLCVILQTTN